MRLSTIFIAVLFVLAGACKPKSEFEVTEAMINSVPDSVLSVEQMINIMTDVHLAEAWAQENKRDTIPADVRLKAYYTTIFSIHQVEAEKYNSSFKYYSNDPVLMNHIYTKVVEQLNIMESKQLKVKKSTTNEQDSKQR